MPKAKQIYYAVHRLGNDNTGGIGQKIGVFTNRADYKQHVLFKKGVIVKRFDNQEDADYFATYGEFRK